ncbi:MAG: retroviral-like aspartic protease family protein [Flavisolibacter sp.]
MKFLALVKVALFLSLCMSLQQQSIAQDYNEYIHTKDGKSLETRHKLILACVRNYGAPAGNAVVKQICECEVNLLDRRYTMKEIREYQKKYRTNGFARLIEQDTLLQNQIKECSQSSNVLLYSIPAYRQSFVTKCIENLRASTDKPVNDTLAAMFCNCAADIMEQRKLTLDKMDDLSNPSSLLYNEIAFKCGSPFLEPSDFAKDWKPTNAKDIVGPDIDSVQVISVMGIHKIKIKIGNEVRVWMIDSGASDLLVSDEYAKKLKASGVISERNYIGEGRYSLADNRIVSCKRYKIDGVHIGNMVVNNVILATSKDAAEFLAGKSLLNKFTEWTIDNKNNYLILKK